MSSVTMHVQRGRGQMAALTLNITPSFDPNAHMIWIAMVFDLSMNDV